MIQARCIASSILFIISLAHFVHAQDLSSYRKFQLGTKLPAIAKETDLAISAAKVIHERPVLMQELSWRPGISYRSSPEADSVNSMLFDFYDGELSRIVVEYDSYKTKGMTDEDMSEAVSAKYGPATKPSAATTISSSQVYNDKKVVIARWENAENSITLFRSSFQPNFGLLAISKRLDALAQTATAEANRLDQEEAPQREVARLKKQDDDNHAAQENVG